MTEIEQARIRLVASPRLSPTEEGLDELLFGSIESTGLWEYVHRFYALNGGPVVIP